MVEDVLNRCKPRLGLLGLTIANRLIHPGDDPRCLGHRRTAGPADASCPHLGNERRQLPAQAQPPKTNPAARPLNLPSRTRFGGGGPLPLRSRAPPPTKTTTSPLLLLAPFSSAPVVYF